MQCHVLARYCTLQRTGGIRGGAARRGGPAWGQRANCLRTSTGLPDALHFGTLRAGHFQRRAGEEGQRGRALANSGERGDGARWRAGKTVKEGRGRSKRRGGGWFFAFRSRW